MVPKSRDLRCFEFFSSYSDEELERDVIPYLSFVTYEAKKFICRERAPGDRCFFLVGGKVDIQMTLASGRVESIAELKPGYVFGQLVLLDGGTRSASCYASKPCSVLELTREDFDHLRRQGSRFAFDIQLEIARSLGQQLRTATENLSAMSESHVEDPVALSRRLESMLRGKRIPGEAYSSQVIPALKLRDIKL